MLGFVVSLCVRAGFNAFLWDGEEKGAKKVELSVFSFD